MCAVREGDKQRVDSVSLGGVGAAACVADGCVDGGGKVDL